MTTRWASRPLNRRGVGTASPHLVGALLLAAAVCFGTVHAGPRLVVGSVALVVGMAAIVDGVRRGVPSKRSRTAWALLVACAGLSLVAFVPLGPEGRALLQPGLAPVIDGSLGLVGRTHHPLAVDPRGALIAGVMGMSCLVLGLGACFIARRHDRLVQLATWIAATGTVLVAVHLVERAAGHALVAAVPGVGHGTNVSSWGPFVNHNHAGHYLAATLPVAIGVAVGRRHPARWWLIGAAGLVAVGVATTESRSALPLAMTGCLALLALSGHRWGAPAGVVGLAMGAAIAIFVGPARLAQGWTRWVEPERLARHDVLSGRLETWAAARGVITDAPLAGVGPGGFGDAFLVAKRSPTYAIADHAHQEPLQMLAEHGVVIGTGWVVLLLLLIAWGAVGTARLEPGRRRWLRAGLVAASLVLVGAAMIDFPLRIGATAYLGAVLVGSVIGAQDEWRSRSAGTRRWILASTGGLAAAALTLLVLLVTAGPTSTFGSGDAARAAGSAALAEGSLEDAEASYALALARRPLDARALIGLARVHYARGDVPTAIDVLDLAVNAWPTGATALAARARLHRDTGQRAHAVRDYQAVLALDLHEEEELTLVREALALAGEDLAAVLPERADRQCQAARELWRSGDEERARALYLENAPRRERCAVEWAEDLIRSGRPGQALEVLAPLTPGCGTLRARGLALVALSRHARALTPLDAAMSECPRKDVTLRFAVAQARIGTGDPSGVGILEALVEQHPERAYLRRYLVEVYLDRGRRPEALVQLRWLVDNGQASDEEQTLLMRLEGSP